MSWADEPAKELLTQRERKALELLDDFKIQMDLIIGQDSTRGGDIHESTYHVHALQQRIMAQAAARAYPEEFRLLGERLR